MRWVRGLSSSRVVRLSFEDVECGVVECAVVVLWSMECGVWTVDGLVVFCRSALKLAGKINAFVHL